MATNVDGIYFPPRDATKEEKKDIKYGLAYARAIYSKYTNDSSSLYNKKSRFVINRKYAEGTHDMSKFRDQLNITGDESYMNLDLTPVAVLPKFIDLLVGEITNQDFKVQANAIDDRSKTKFDEYKKDLYKNFILRQLNQQVEARAGVSIIDKDVPVLESEEKIKTYLKNTFKQASEKAIEQAVTFVFQNNKLKEIKRRVVKDLINLKWGATATYFDSNYDVKMRYVDPRNLVIPYTTEPDCGDLEYSGQVVKMNFHDLRSINRTLTDEQLMDVMKTHGKNSAGYSYDRIDEKGAYYGDGVSYLNMNDDFYVDVLDFEFKSSNFDLTYEKKYYQQNGFFLNKKGSGYTSNPNSKKKTEVISKYAEAYYDGMWIVGSEYVVNYALRENLIRPKNNKGSYSSKCLSRFQIYGMDIYDMQSKSMTERCIPHVDQIQLAHLKIQQVIAKARPQGIIIDVSGLEDVMKGKGGSTLSPLELTEIYDQTGNYYYRGTDPDGVQYNRPPITPAPNGLSSDLERLIGIYNYNLEMIRTVTGINEFRDGSTPDNRTLVGVQKMAIGTSRNSTRPLVDSFFNIMERTVNYIVLMIQLKAKYDKNGLSGMLDALGKETIDILELNKEVSYATLGIKIEMLPDYEEIERMNMEIERSLQTGSIELEDAFEIRDVLKQNMKEAIDMLKVKREERRQQKMQESMALSQQNADVQVQSAQATAQMDAQLEQVKHQSKMQQMELEYRLKIELEMAKSQGDIEEERVKGDERLKQIKLQMLDNFIPDSGERQIDRM